MNLLSFFKSVFINSKYSLTKKHVNQDIHVNKINYVSEHFSKLFCSCYLSEYSFPTNSRTSGLKCSVKILLHRRELCQSSVVVKVQQGRREKMQWDAISPPISWSKKIIFPLKIFTCK